MIVQICRFIIEQPSKFHKSPCLSYRNAESLIRMPNPPKNSITDIYFCLHIILGTRRSTRRKMSPRMMAEEHVRLECDQDAFKTCEKGKVIRIEMLQKSKNVTYRDYYVSHNYFKYCET